MAATFFMVSGGTYGTEQIISGAGYGHGILILLFLPVLWCLPTAFMIGELSSALPCEGGYYAWVRRGLGNFWGFQEAWLSLAASIFDMAIYPTLFVFYLKQCLAVVWHVRATAILAGLFVVVSLRGSESRGHSRRGHHVAVAVLLPVGAVRGDRGACAVQGGGAGRSARRAGGNRTRACSAAFWSPCGTTWAGTTPRRSRRKSSARSAPIRRR